MRWCSCLFALGRVLQRALRLRLIGSAIAAVGGRASLRMQPAFEAVRASLNNSSGSSALSWLPAQFEVCPLGGGWSSSMIRSPCCVRFPSCIWRECTGPSMLSRRVLHDADHAGPSGGVFGGGTCHPVTVDWSRRQQESQNRRRGARNWVGESNAV